MNRTMGVRAAIKDNIPFEREYILKKHRVYSKYVEYVYYHNIPINWRNKYRYPASVRRVKHILKYMPFLQTFRYLITPEGKRFWEEINMEIINYTEECK